MVKSRRRRRFQINITRDGILFVCGLIGVYHETFASQDDRVYLLVLFGGMLGLPTLLHFDEWKRSRRDEDDDDANS